MLPAQGYFLPHIKCLLEIFHALWLSQTAFFSPKFKQKLISEKRALPTRQDHEAFPQPCLESGMRWLCWALLHFPRSCTCIWGNCQPLGMVVCRGICSLEMSQNLLSLWKTKIFQGAEGSHEDGQGKASLCPAADAQGKDTARVCRDEMLPALVK